jgi:hypothetical protein
MNTYTVLTGESYQVEASSPEEAVAKFYWAHGHLSDEDTIENGYDITDWNAQQVEEWETMTEVVA